MENSEFVSSIKSDDDKYNGEETKYFEKDENEDTCVVHKESSRLLDLIADQILCLEFGSEEEGYNFYQLYAKYHGFVVRKDDTTKDIRGNIIMRQFVCNREGERNKKHFMMVDRKREHRPLTRTKCLAKLRIHYDHNSLKWKVVSFEQCHNHELTPSRFVHLHLAYRGLTDADMAQVNSLHAYGLRGCHIMGFLVAQKGGHCRVGFMKKDMYNYLDRKNQAKVKKGDVRAGLSYLQGKADSDPLLYGKYSTGSDGKLKRLFWADGVSRYDFHCFGDVLAFDTTYKKNKYNCPVVIFSGCNHHSQTVIFGCALVSDETIETYKWVLEAFLDAMGNKKPKTVVTDSDSTMREAIKHVFLESCHRLCAWHLHKNACENVKNSPFLDDFKRAMYSNFTPDEFEEFWNKKVVEHVLMGNKWVTKTYENKALCATTYLWDNFFGRIRTTSQCESINSFIRSYCKNKSSMVEFLHKFEQAKKEYKNNEMMAEFKSLFSELVLTTYLRSIEREAPKIYTL